MQSERGRKYETPEQRYVRHLSRSNSGPEEVSMIVCLAGQYKVG